MYQKIFSQNLDANEALFFSRELEHIKARSYDVKYPEFKARQFFPVSTEAGPAADTITYRQYDGVGQAKIIADYADDLPRSDAFGKEFTSNVRSIGSSYGYSIQDIRKSMREQRSLPQRKANSTRRSIEQKIEDIAWYGSADDNLFGILNQPNVPTVTVPNGASPVAPQWAGKTPDEILLDLNTSVNTIINTTNGVEIPDTIILPILQYQQIHQTPRGADNDTTIAEFFLKSNPYINSFEWDIHLKDVDPLPSGGAGPFDVMITYKKNIDNLSFEIPQPYEAFAAQERGLEFYVPTHARCGGIIVYYPLSILISEKI